MHRHQKRVLYLDGLRGVAILSVMLWHYTNWDYARFFPYGTAYAAIPVLDHGWVGVNIFFLISGYVILLTLDRCSTFLEFMVRRWFRLFPAMLIASLIVFSASRVIGDHMPHGRPDPVNLLPGLTFLIPPLWQSLLGRPVGELDGVYWTLYVEMGFYVTFGFLYFWLGWRRGIAGLAILWLSIITTSRLANGFELTSVKDLIEHLRWMGAEYFGWFVSGALFLKASETASHRLFVLAVIAGLASALTSGLWQPSDALSCIYLSGCVAFFAVAQRSKYLQQALSTPALLFVGAVSYPLYLLHNELGIGLIGATAEALPEGRWLVLPLFMMGLMLAMAWAVSRWLEPCITQRFRGRLLSLVRKGGPAAPSE